MHKPVMLSEVLEWLRPQPGMTIVDATVGAGGHAHAIAERLGDTGTLIALDRDESMLERAQARLEPLPCTKHFVHADYRDLPLVLDELGIQSVDGILIDMGVCTDQLDDPERGLAFRFDAPLDMRLDRSQSTTAYHLLQKIRQEQLVRILREYGEERWAVPIAKRIIQRRNQGRMNTTGDLVAAVMEAIPRRFHDRRIHPATRTFQAIRIAVNRELDGLQEALEAICHRLKVGGRICVLAYHSLEDRAVKHAFRNLSGRVPTPAGAGLSEAPSHPILRILTPKPLEPSEAETEANPRARSAKLRVAERVE
ncbi:MAG: 16S rRNA (cytosine(1402)-N(4))-methyltransferase RsmH [Fimbriimonadales bacterium]|jgi:16S rRNA (cytosine1402-N4)-methyltransferase|nr:16S rRNA (cytosine(1402)-N(4))-methyltransferase RsmH [Fimbriimonadales bacterium]